MEHAFSKFIKRFICKLLAYLVSTICKLCKRIRQKLVTLQEEVMSNDNE